MTIKQGSRIVFTGDSITDCGRGRPFGDNVRDTLGNGYVALVDAMVTALHAELDLRIINTGVSGDTVRDLAHRWERDVLAHEPDWVSVMIGINDVWRQFDTDPALLRPVTDTEYRTTLTRLLNEAKPHISGLVVMTPFYLEGGPHDPMRPARNKYAAITEEVARELGALLIDTQRAFERVLPYRGRERLAPDGVHPTLPGHTILAVAWLGSVGLWQGDRMSL